MLWMAENFRADGSCEVNNVDDRRGESTSSRSLSVVTPRTEGPRVRVCT